MLRVANSRYRLLEIDVYDVLVQGESAAASIVNALSVADTKEYDIIILARGGGSIEDLWAFNEEIVADAVFKAKTPIISAVGHEIDWVISDFVADLRAPTPSAAMQMCLPDTNELYQYLDTLASQLTQTITQKIAANKQELVHLQNSFMQHSIEKKIIQKKQEVQQLKERFEQSIDFKIQNLLREPEHLRMQFTHAIDSKLHVAQNQLLNLKKMLESNNPKFKSKSGFAQISKDNRVIELSLLEVGDTFEAQDDTLSVYAKVLKKSHI